MSNQVIKKITWNVTPIQVESAIRDGEGNVITAKYQDKLVSGTTLKTINGNSLLGSGNITIVGTGQAAAEWQYYEGNSYGECYSVTGPNGNYSIQIGDSGLTIDKYDPITEGSNADNVFRVDGTHCIYNGKALIKDGDLKLYRHTVNIFPSSSSGQCLMVTFISTRSTIYTTWEDLIPNLYGGMVCGISLNHAQNALNNLALGAIAFITSSVKADSSSITYSYHYSSANGGSVYCSTDNTIDSTSAVILEYSSNIYRIL